MKKLIFGLVSSIMVHCLKDQQQDFTYDKFQKKYGRKNQEEQKRNQRKGIFQKRYKQLVELSDTNPSLGIHKFMDWTQLQLKDFFSLKSQQKEKSHIKREQSTFARLQSTAIPTYFNYRDLQKTTPIKDQGDCGACWAFAATAAFESRIMLQSNIQYDLSQQYAIDCLIPEPSYRCAGGYPGYALLLYNLTGAPLQNQYPYYQISNIIGQDKQGYTDQKMCTQTNSYIKLASSANDVTFSYTMTDSQLISQLINTGPIVVGIKGDDPNFLALKKFPYQVNQCPSSSIVNHAIVLVGYTSTHYIIRNSWNTDWGDNGYAYISRANDCGIKSYVVTLKTSTNASNYQQTNVKLIINMTDSGSNGWGWVLGLRQNGTIVMNFSLSSGYSGIMSTSINARLRTDIVVVKSSRAKSDQIGFKILYNISGTVLYSRASGSSFSNNIGTVIGTFCPSYCPPTFGSSLENLQQFFEQQQNLSKSTQDVGISKAQIIMISIISALTMAVIFLVVSTCYFYRLYSKINVRAQKTFSTFQTESTAKQIQNASNMMQIKNIK